ncbi:Os07g0605600, partial [Oryza sativa Japonica Group]
AGVHVVPLPPPPAPPDGRHRDVVGGRAPLCGCRGGWRRLRRAAAAARSPERRRRRCGAAAYEQRNGDAGVAVATCRSSRARPSSPYPAACASRRRRCGLLHLHRGGAQPGRRRRPQAISYTVRSGRLDALALLLLLAADIPHGERRRAVWRRAPGRVPAGRGGDGVGAPRPRHAGGARQPVLRTGTCSPGRWWLFNSDHWTLISEAATRQMVEDNAVNLSALCLLACRLMLVHTCTACCYRLCLLAAVQPVLICRPLPIASATSRRMLDADASQLACGRVVVGRLSTPTASIGGGGASPARAAPPAFNAAAVAGAGEATAGCRHLRGDADASRGGETQAALTRSWARRENGGGGCVVAGREGVEHSGG